MVNARDDLGCRPRQFTATQARAIRDAQVKEGLTEALWEGWDSLVDSLGSDSWRGDMGWATNWKKSARKPLAKTDRFLNVTGIRMSYIELSEIHLVPTTVGDPGAQAPWVNVRAKCVKQTRDYGSYSNAIWANLADKRIYG